jgi:diguanylate cyclase (GGDEF)-like protein
MPVATSGVDVMRVRIHRGTATPAPSVRRLFLVYAAVSLFPVVVLGGVLFGLMHRQATSSGLAEGRAEATLVARSAITPALAVSSPLGSTITGAQKSRLSTDVVPSVRGGRIVRLRIRNLSGDVVWSSDGTGIDSPRDDEALRAAGGEAVVHLTDLNADLDSDQTADGDGDDDDGGSGPRVVEAYVPLLGVDGGHQIGVLEIYLPYAPIAADVAKGQRIVGTTLLLGLLMLWLVLLAVSTSVTGRIRKASAANAHLATHDALTGLPNRGRFEVLTAGVVTDAAPGVSAAVAILDLDRFKQVNDTLGHGNGDILLSVLAERLSDRLRESDCLARLGGDEFGIILGGVHGPGEAVEILGRLRDAVKEPMVVGGLPLALEASVGFALTPDDGTDVETLLTRAEIAMYVAKERHLGVVHYRPDHNRHDTAALGLVAELNDGIIADQLVLHYQPKTDLRSGRVSAIEALVRWNHPTRGLLYPDTFLPAAEQTELVEPLTRWVVTRALAELPSFDPTGELAVAVNVSARSLGRDDFAEEILDIVRRSGIAPSRVIVEVTETALVTDTRGAELTVMRFHEAGIRVSIDDFGAGQTSLAYLADLRVAELKIDKSFVIAMSSDVKNAAIVRSVIELGHSLGLTVTAEGVETEAILDELTAAGCDLVQGYLLSRPLTAEKLREHLADAVVRRG